MPDPIGPRQQSTSTSPGLTPASLIAATAARSVVNTLAGPIAVDAVRVHNRWIDRRRFDDRSFRGEVAARESRRSRSSRAPRPARRHDDFVRIDAVACSASRLRTRFRRSDLAHQSRTDPSGSPATVRALRSSNPKSRRCCITSGTPPAKNTRIVGWPTGPFGRASTIRGTFRLIAVQSSTVGLVSPAWNATAGR